VSSCVSPQGSFLAFRTFDGSIVLMQVDSNRWEKILAFERDDTLSVFGVLSAVVEQHKTASGSTASRNRRLLQCLRQYDRGDMDASAHDESAIQLDADQRAINTTSFVLNNGRDGRNQDSNVSVSDESSVATAHSRSLEGLVPASASSRGAWTRSLHACFGGEEVAVSGEAAAVCQRSIYDNESGEVLNVYYGGVAVTENRVLGMDGADQTMETKMNDAKPVDAFLSITDTRESSSDKESVRVHSKRRKTSSSISPPASCPPSSSVELLMIPL
jgi:hypothetical protein